MVAVLNEVEETETEWNGMDWMDLLWDGDPGRALH
jgi:hypothetical protein